ncbi:ferric-chelate reductase 1-like [Amphiura filiformis]|uniref:ferric-chelate reductase 1-like n=1 Tax=Amphiura filiformis TaxID=82378 RepID=UPI003B223C81
MSPHEGHRKSLVTRQSYPRVPFSLLVNNRTYVPGQHIQVILTGDINFKGFFVQARSMEGDSGVPLGRFINPHVGSKVMSCSLSPTAANAWSHMDKYHKSDTTATWVAPPSNEGNIFFRATVVKEKSIYWENIFSDIVHYTGPIYQPTEPPELEPKNVPCTGGPRLAASITTSMMRVIVALVLIILMF